MVNTWTFFMNNPQASTVIGLSVLGFLFRAYRLEKDKIHYSSKEAGYRTLGAIVVMIILSLFLNSERIVSTVKIKETLKTVSVLIYYGIAFAQTIDNDHPERNRLLSILKFILIAMYAVGSNGLKLILSIITLSAGINIVRTYKIAEDIDQILHTEILLLCVENLAITIFAVLSIVKNDVASLIMLVVFTETVLYSINYMVVFHVKERLLFVD